MRSIIVFHPKSSPPNRRCILPPSSEQHAKNECCTLRGHSVVSGGSAISIDHIATTCSSCHFAKRAAPRRSSNDEDENETISDDEDETIPFHHSPKRSNDLSTHFSPARKGTIVSTSPAAIVTMDRVAGTLGRNGCKEADAGRTDLYRPRVHTLIPA
jgi:hypothetical protein